MIFLRKFKESILFRTQFIRKKYKYDLIIFDDLLPAPGSPWRNHELNELVKAFPNSVAYTRLQSFSQYSVSNDFKTDTDTLSENFPVIAAKLEEIKPLSNINTRLVYCLFYANIVWLFPFIKKHKVNFAFTLYPGGGFALNDPSIDILLKEIINSPYCQFVIITQNVTYDYLTKALQIPKEKLKLVFGVTMKLPDDIGQVNNHFSEKTSKSKLKCVFVAHKYTPYGLDKGFDTFQNLAYNMRENPNFDFHVVGNFDENDLLIKSDKWPNNLYFEGRKMNEDLDEFLDKMDIIISPNRSNVLKPGAFDGFPLGAAVQSSLNGCAMLLSNERNEGSKLFKNNIHYVKINNDILEIEKYLIHLFENQDVLRKMSQEGKQKVKEVYSYQEQILPRIDAIKTYLGS